MRSLLAIIAALAASCVTTIPPARPVDLSWARGVAIYVEVPGSVAGWDDGFPWTPGDPQAIRAAAGSALSAMGFRVLARAQEKGELHVTVDPLSTRICNATVDRAGEQVARISFNYEGL